MHVLVDEGLILCLALPPHSCRDTPRQRLIRATMYSTLGDLLAPSKGMVIAPFSYPCSDSLVIISAASNPTMGSFILRQGEHRVPHWGGEKRSEFSSPATRSPPQPFSPTRIYPQRSNVSDLSATPLSSLGSFQRLALTPSRSSDQQHPVLTPSESLPRRRPVSTSSNVSPPRHPVPSTTTRIPPPSRSQQTPVHRQPNQYLGQSHSEKSSVQHQEHCSSQELPALLSPHRRDMRVTRATPSIPPTPNRPLSERGLDQRLIAITSASSGLTHDRTFCLKIYIF